MSLSSRFPRSPARGESEGKAEPDREGIENFRRADRIQELAVQLNLSPTGRAEELASTARSRASIMQSPADSGA